MSKFMTMLMLIGILLGISSGAFAEEVPFTLEDRDRLIRMETTIKEFREAVDKRFESMDKRFESMDRRFESIDKRFESIDKWFDQLINIFIGIIAAFAGIVAVTIGFAIWDRRTALRPAIERTDDLRIREEKLERAVKEYARGEPKLQEILKSLGLW